MKSLPKFSIENYQFVLMIFLILLVMGISSFFNMPRTEDPPIVVPGAVISVIYPGAGPKDIEELVVTKIEESVNELEDIEEIRSNVSDGFAVINISFGYDNTDFDSKYDEVVQQVNSIINDLPSDIREISFKKKTTTDTKILQLALSSDFAEFETLEKHTETLKRELENINGIRKIEILAVPSKQVKIELNIEKMVNMGITIDEISNAINSNNQNIPGGDIDIGTKSFNIKTSGSYNSLEEIRNTVVSSAEGNLIYLKDIADIKFDYESNNYLARFNSKRSIFITAEQKEDLNILDIMDEAKIKIEKFKSELPSGIELYYVHNQAESVRSSVNGFINNLIQGIVLVGLFIMLAIGIKSSLVIIIAIPASILIGLGFVDLAGYGLQNISIAALVIALGLLVDNSIVVIENTERYMQSGLNSRDAAIKGTSQVANAITSSTLTTLAAFIPIAMLKDASGDFLSSLPVTVITTLTASLIIALTVSPMFLTKLIRLKPGEKPKEQPLQKRLKKFIHGPYKKLLTYSLNHTRTVLIVTILVFVSALFVFLRFVDVSFYPKAEKPQFIIKIKMPQGTNLNETNKTANYVESVLDTIPEVKHYATNVGHGNPKVYFNHFSADYAMSMAEILVVLKKYDAKEFNATITKLRSVFSNYTLADIMIKEFQQGVPIQNPIEIVLYGNDLNKLIDISESIENIAKNQDGTINVVNELDGVKTDIYVNINKNKAALLGVPVSEFDKTVRTMMNGAVVSQFRNDEGEEYDIVLQLPVKEKANFDDFDKIFVTSLTGNQIPLSQLASIEFAKGPNHIFHYNKKRSTIIGADVKKGYNTYDVTMAIEEQLKNFDFPVGFGYHLAGEVEKQEKSFGGLGVAAFIAVLIIMTILVFQFHSFKQPFIIFISVPLALIGSIYALFISGFSFSFTAFVGVVALIGIVINDAIILIDFTNELRKDGKSIYEALIEAGQIRFTPILITSVTTIGGLLPLTLQGGAFWGPLGWTIIGGLTLSTTLTLILIPVIYLLLEKENKIITT